MLAQLQSNAGREGSPIYDDDEEIEGCDADLCTDQVPSEFGITEAELFALCKNGQSLPIDYKYTSYTEFDAEWEECLRILEELELKGVFEEDEIREYTYSPSDIP